MGRSARSLPSRECGLKFGGNWKLTDSGLSLPSRECGLKFLWGMMIVFVAWASLPSRECGLK